MMIDETLREAVQNSFAICDSLQIPYSNHISNIRSNSRLRRKWGYCKKDRNENGQTSFTISIADRLLQDDVKEKKLLSVLLHEILHTCPGCFNHGERWRHYAKQIKKAYGIKITKTASAEKLKLDCNYHIQCRNCKTISTYAMKPMHRKNICCGICGSRKLTCYCKEPDKEKVILWKEK